MSRQDKRDLLRLPHHCTWLNLASYPEDVRPLRSALPAATRQVESEKQDLSRTDASLSVLITHERTKQPEEETQRRRHLWRDPPNEQTNKRTNERKL